MHTLQHTATEHHLGAIKCTYMSCTLLQQTATYCINTAAYCDTLQQTIILASLNVHTCMYVYDCNILQQYCKILQHPATDHHLCVILLQCASFCNTYSCTLLQPTALHCNILQHRATDHHLGVIECTLTIVAHCNTLQHTATHCNTLQHTATHCNTLQHTATHCNRASPWLD